MNEGKYRALVRISFQFADLLKILSDLSVDGTSDTNIVSVKIVDSESQLCHLLCGLGSTC